LGLQVTLKLVEVRVYACWALLRQYGRDPNGHALFGRHRNRRQYVCLLRQTSLTAIQHDVIRNRQGRGLMPSAGLSQRMLTRFDNGIVTKAKQASSEDQLLVMVMPKVWGECTR